jgi:hypothetical protein
MSVDDKSPSHEVSGLSVCRGGIAPELCGRNGQTVSLRCPEILHSDARLKKRVNCFAGTRFAAVDTKWTPNALPTVRIAWGITRRSPPAGKMPWLLACRLHNPEGDNVTEKVKQALKDGK